MMIMAMRSDKLPPLPRDTARAAEAVFGKGNIYLAIGDEFEALLTDIDLARLDPIQHQSDSQLAVLALVTVFQYVEGLPDRRAVEAVRTRADWKYALHLPMAYRGLEYAGLCRFRQIVLNDAAAQEVFQQIFDRLARTGLLRNADMSPSNGRAVLTAVCAASRLEQLIDAMQATLEALAALDPQWLLAHALPHWYERYNQIFTTHVLRKINGEQAMIAQAIGKDAQFLLDAIDKSGGDLARLSEAQALRQIWQQQFSQGPQQIEWRMPVCMSCGRSH